MLRLRHSLAGATSRVLQRSTQTSLAQPAIIFNRHLIQPSAPSPSVRAFSSSHDHDHTPYSSPASSGSISAPWYHLRVQSQQLLATLLAKAPRGFGGFYPKDGKDSQNEPETSEKRDENKDAEDDKASEFLDNFFKLGQNKEGDGKGSKDSGSGGGDSGKPSRTMLLLGGLGGLLLIVTLAALEASGDSITFQEFKTRYLEHGLVKSMVVQNKTHVVAQLIPSDNPSQPQVVRFSIGSVEAFERQMEMAQRQLRLHPDDWVPIRYETSGNIVSSLIQVVPNLLLLYFMYRAMKGASSMISQMGGKGGKGIFGVGKSPATMIKPGEKTNVTFKDVAGLDQAKVEVVEFINFLKDPSRFTRLGAKIPKGALLVGPPGTGKTLLAKATAGESNVPFFSISGSDFIEMFVGVGPSRVRDLFAEARKNSPCIIFIDEIDAIGRARGSGKFGGGNEERENTLNQLLVEMDGFQTTEGVVVLAGTNRVDILDKALLRPGRFDRTINIDKPDINGRKQIFEVYLKKLKLANNIGDLAPRMAALTPGFAGADIANVCNEAALIAARSGKDSVELVDFEKACDRIIGGLEKQGSILTKLERKLVAYHEAGHAVAGWFLEHADPLLKVTIVPRGSGALGFAQYLPKEVALYQQEQLLDMMCMALGGRAAEQVFFGRISTGASDDLKKVTSIASNQVSVFGMSRRLGNVSYQNDDQSFTKPFSEQTAQIIDEEVRKIIDTAYERVLALIEEKRELVHTLAEKLLELETINHDILVQVMGPRPFADDAYKTYLANANKELPVADVTKESAEAAKKSESESSTATSESQDSSSNKKEE